MYYEWTGSGYAQFVRFERIDPNVIITKGKSMQSASRFVLEIPIVEWEALVNQLDQPGNVECTVRWQPNPHTLFTIRRYRGPRSEASGIRLPMFHFVGWTYHNTLGTHFNLTLSNAEWTNVLAFMRVLPLPGPGATRYQLIRD